MEARAQTTPAGRRLVLITGGSSGIGRGVAAAFVQQGARVALLARNPDRLRQATRELGDDVIGVVADVRSSVEVSHAIEQLVAAEGPLHVVVNAAGVLQPLRPDAPLSEAEQVWDHTIDTNLKGSFLVCWAAAPHIVSPGGRIVLLSSVAAVTGGRSPGLCPYAASKAGLHGMAFALARQLGPRGITVNTVALGLITDTELFPDGTEIRAQRVAAQTPLGRAGRIDDAVAAIVHLASADASFITGELLHVNGGLVFGR